ncbi:hypothetical protein B484DRAFT_399065 [Ochromonadaceae sp. CCMP2298]|nr:hypothetical protein B484DRAFT_399065 [Ochromonadaceae sp. CCMP2298]
MLLSKTAGRTLRLQGASMTQSMQGMQGYRAQSRTHSSTRQGQGGIATPATGFDKITERVASIVVNVTEKQASKVLNVYPHNGLTRYLAEHPCYDVVGLSDESQDRDLPSKADYSSVEYASFGEGEEGEFRSDLRSASFHAVCCCLPLPSDLSEPRSHIPLKELLRVLSGRGYLVFGCEAGVFESAGFMATLVDLSGPKGLGSLLTVQNMALCLGELRDSGASVSDTVVVVDGGGFDTVDYVIATFRKK